MLVHFKIKVKKSGYIEAQCKIFEMSNISQEDVFAYLFTNVL